MYCKLRVGELIRDLLTVFIKYRSRIISPTAQDNDGGQLRVPEWLGTHWTGLCVRRMSRKPENGQMFGRKSGCNNDRGLGTLPLPALDLFI